MFFKFQGNQTCDKMVLPFHEKIDGKRTHVVILVYFVAFFTDFTKNREFDIIVAFLASEFQLGRKSNDELI